jgi:hypothetical protein
MHKTNIFNRYILNKYITYGKVSLFTGDMNMFLKYPKNI